MKLKETLEFYLGGHSHQGHQDLYLVPDRKFAIHALEIGEKPLKVLGQSFLKMIESDIQKLKSVKIKKGNSPHHPKTLYDLIKAWNTKSMLGDYELNSLELDYFQDLKREDFLSVIFDDVINGQTPKRDVRLHFTDIKVHFTVCTQGTIRSILVDLKSISENGMLFKVDNEKRGILENSESFDLYVNMNSYLEETKSIEECFEAKYQSENRIKNEYSLPMGFEVDTEQLSFMKSRIDMAIELGKSNKNYMWIPFSALTDPILLDVADCGQIIREELEELKDSLYYEDLLKEVI